MPTELSVITPAQPKDLQRLGPLACQFYAASKFLRAFDMERFESLWKGLLESGNGVIYVLESNGEITGVIGGVLHPEAYSGELIAQEFFWYVDEKRRGHGIRLYRCLENWARIKGCMELRMAHLSDSMPEKVADFYRRVGYEKVETLYAKRLDEVAELRRAG